MSLGEAVTHVLSEDPDTGGCCSWGRITPGNALSLDKMWKQVSEPVPGARVSRFMCVCGGGCTQQCLGTTPSMGTRQGQSLHLRPPGPSRPGTVSFDSATGCASPKTGLCGRGGASDPGPVPLTKRARPTPHLGGAGPGVPVAVLVPCPGPPPCPSGAPGPGEDALRPEPRPL